MIANYQTTGFNATPRIDTIIMIRKYNSFIKLTRSGIPFWEARKICGLVSDDQLEISRILYEKALS